MREYLIEQYSFDKDQAIKIEKEYNLLITNTNSNLTIDEFVKVINDFSKYRTKTR